MLSGRSYVSRASFCREIRIGGGAVRTLISRMRESGLVDSTRSGTFLTDRGSALAQELLRVLPAECPVPDCEIAPGAENYAVLLRGHADAVRSGLEQRDYAVVAGSRGAVTIVYRNARFLFPGGSEPVPTDDSMLRHLAARLNPHEGDVVIVAVSDDRFVSEMAAKSAALQTLVA